METLKLEHIAPYLPYGLKGIASGKIYKLKAIKTGRSDCYWIKEKDPYIFGVWGLRRIKPLLRPLSQLTEEIEHNGDKFVPIDYNAFKHDKDHLVDFANNFKNYKSVKYGIMERLFEWHFDVFGLIEKGLAVPIE